MCIYIYMIIHDYTIIHKSKHTAVGLVEVDQLTPTIPWGNERGAFRRSLLASPGTLWLPPWKGCRGRRGDGWDMNQGLGLMSLLLGIGGNHHQSPNICWRLYISPVELGDVKHWDIYQPL